MYKISTRLVALTVCSRPMSRGAFWFCSSWPGCCPSWRRRGWNRPRCPTTWRALIRPSAALRPRCRSPAPPWHRQRPRPPHSPRKTSTNCTQRFFYVHWPVSNLKLNYMSISQQPLKLKKLITSQSVISCPASCCACCRQSHNFQTHLSYSNCKIKSIISPRRQFLFYTDLFEGAGMAAMHKILELQTPLQEMTVGSVCKLRMQTCPT